MRANSRPRSRQEDIVPEREVKHLPPRIMLNSYDKNMNMDIQENESGF